MRGFSNVTVSFDTLLIRERSDINIRIRQTLVVNRVTISKRVNVTDEIIYKFPRIGDWGKQIVWGTWTTRCG